MSAARAVLIYNELVTWSKEIDKMAVKITDQEKDVLNTAIDFAMFTQAVGCGVPMQKHVKKAEAALLRACDALFAEFDGVEPYYD